MVLGLLAGRRAPAQVATSSRAVGSSAERTLEAAASSTTALGVARRRPPRADGEGEAPAPAPTAMPLVIEGNVVLLDEVYQTVLHYAGWASAPEGPVERSRWIESTLEDFLHASGYELASVVVLPEGPGFEVLIDEGRLDKIIFRNVDPWTTVQLLFLLDLPQKVFNRDLLSRRLWRVREKMAVERIEYEVVPVDEPEHDRLQLEDPKIIEGLTLLSPGEPHELRISFERRERRAGLDLGFGFQPPDGLLVEGSHLALGVLAREDRLITRFRVGVRLADIGRIPGNRIGLSRAGGGLNWSTPSLFDLLRFTARARVDLEARRREDLEIVNYFFAPVQLGLGFSLEGGGIRFAASGGLEQRSFFGAREEEGAEAPILGETEGTNLRAYADARLAVVFNPDRLRRDRPHRITLSGRYLWPMAGAQGDIRELRGSYRNTVPVGFDELRYELEGAWLDGQVPFYSELPMGEGFLRSAFQGTVYARQLAALNLEYRFSLSRDELKLGLFNDVVVYEGLDALREPEGLRLIDNFGLGLHILLVDAFQVNGYFGVGIRSDGEADLGFSLDVQQAF